MEIQKAVIQKELEEEAKEMNMNVHGYKDVISMYFKWAEEHEVINIFVLYSMSDHSVVEGFFFFLLSAWFFFFTCQCLIAYVLLYLDFRL